MKLKDIHSVYFIGIGGIGMSALARYFKYVGKEVSGYDRTSSPITDALIENGITVHFEDSIKKRSEVLGIITKDTFCFSVAGTH